ncbi:nitroreductase family protein [Puniceicoccales bacterium CK1056]|uniref:Nitroreductase family protein n=1 Tax=Oceanipulchritudo coccoides TaxID=2706888 RepID=A0A6B2LZM7_9BACT|nr:nitroreductase family protein [Oceanipulchritudo coccoides]NDV61903.1 nitroreductase family protein [Oceanipulchritudo coccoides]
MANSDMATDANKSSTPVKRISYSVPLLSPRDMQSRAKAVYKRLSARRSVRDFSTDPIPEGVLEDAIRSAGTAPNGANQQPWHFAVVRDPEIKRKIRLAAEEEERAFYNGRAPKEWLNTLAPLGTDAEKPFLETAPALVAIFMKSKIKAPDATLRKTYYPKESVGIATGFLIAALQEIGLSTLTHTPSPMQFLNQILDRPPEEKPFLLLVVGYPSKSCTVPAIQKLPLEQISSFQ